MTRNLKALGLALLAVFAMSAVAAQGASAETEHTFTAADAPIDITGHGENHKFTAQGKEVVCETATFTGTADNVKKDSLTVTPHYTGHCTMNPGEVEVTVDATECTFTFESDTTEDPVTGVENAPVDIACPDGQTIKIGLEGLCEIHVQTQTGLHGVEYVDNKNGTVTVKAGVHRIKYTATGGFCFLVGINTGTFEGENGATYEGDAVVKGYVHSSEHTAEDGVNIGLSTP